MIARTKWPGIALGVCAALITQSAMAGATLTHDLREIQVSTDVTLNGINVAQGDAGTPDSDGAAFLKRVLSSVPSGSNPDAFAEASAYQDSSFDAAPVFTSISAEGTVSTHAQIFEFSGTFDATGDADSVFTIRFTIDSPQDWTISASIVDTGSGETGRVRLREYQGEDIFLLQNATGSDSGFGTLDPGEYELIGEARALSFASSATAVVQFREAQFDFDFTIVPEPASGLLMLLVSPMLLRRRSAAR